MKITLIGSVDGLPHYTEQDILLLINQEVTQLVYGAAFMGRPSTCLHVGETAVLKLHNDLDLQTDRARRFVVHALGQEHKLQVHHPHKTWFLIEDGEKCRIGNICPRLQPLHLLANDTDEQINLKINYLTKVYRCYFQVAWEHALRLDDGLSNFGIDSDNQLYYMDDDIYTWDDFVSFVQFLGVMLRGNHWLTEKYAVAFGDSLQSLISEYFKDVHINIKIARQLRDIYMPNNDRQRVLEIIIDRLQSQKIISTKIIHYQQDLLAIFSDIHANLPALEAVLDFLKAQNIQQGIVLGDIVGYGPHPKECIERLQATEFQVLKGNHDNSAATGDTQNGMSKVARWCIDWTIPQLTFEQRKWLDDLPLELKSEDTALKKWLAVHGAPIDPNYFYAYVYQMTYEENLQILQEQNTDFCFHGHSHIQGMYIRNKIGLDSFIKPSFSPLSLMDFKQALICPGAVGQPRDGCLGAQLAIYHQREQTLQFVAINYDMEKTIRDLQRFEFPETLWRRLRQGM